MTQSESERPWKPSPRLRGVKWEHVPKPVWRPCSCDSGHVECLSHVRCDKDCRALLDPGSDVAALKAALEHWRNHALSYGCSHGG